ncbi:unnamed protein product [Danaus chrysippus]|uniref:(African queen) hypothetical protein n=1 Tax=Danaus chrysippus TaxID=151541 RepID=A0A8J2QPI9_9NEOP|nr:unnamed protein product [Danaus chrysippus]
MLPSLAKEVISCRIWHERFAGSPACVIYEREAAPEPEIAPSPEESRDTRLFPTPAHYKPLQPTTHTNSLIQIAALHSLTK